jgi:hypothetical protein
MGPGNLAAPSISRGRELRNYTVITRASRVQVFENTPRPVMCPRGLGFGFWRPPIRSVHIANRLQSLLLLVRAATCHDAEVVLYSRIQKKGAFTSTCSGRRHIHPQLVANKRALFLSRTSEAVLYSCAAMSRALGIGCGRGGEKKLAARAMARLTFSASGQLHRERRRVRPGTRRPPQRSASAGVDASAAASGPRQAGWTRYS